MTHFEGFAAHDQLNSISELVPGLTIVRVSVVGIGTGDNRRRRADAPTRRSDGARPPHDQKASGFRGGNRGRRFRDFCTHGTENCERPPAVKSESAIAACDRDLHAQLLHRATGPVPRRAFGKIALLNHAGETRSVQREGSCMSISRSRLAQRYCHSLVRAVSDVRLQQTRPLGAVIDACAVRPIKRNGLLDLGARPYLVGTSSYQKWHPRQSKYCHLRPPGAAKRLSQDCNLAQSPRIPVVPPREPIAAE